MFCDIVIEIKQTWWHVEEIFHPHIGRKIRQVMDIYVNEQFIPISLDSLKFLGFRVYARNLNNKELAYLEDNCGSEFKILVNLGSLDNYPIVSKTDDNYTSENNGIDLRHVKIEFEYILMNPDIEDQNETKISSRCFNFFRQKKEGNFSIRGNIQPEFYITMPLGWRIGKIDLFSLNSNLEGNQCVLIRKYDSLDKKPEQLKLEMPFISVLEGKRKYNYLISDFVSDKSKSGVNNEHFTYIFSYIAEMSNKIVGISIIPLFYLLIVGLFIMSISYNYILYSKILNLGISTGLSYLISLLAYCYFYASFVKDGYYIPHKFYFMASIILSLFVIVAIFIIALFNENSLDSLKIIIDLTINYI